MTDEHIAGKAKKQCHQKTTKKASDSFSESSAPTYFLLKTLFLPDCSEERKSRGSAHPAGRRADARAPTENWEELRSEYKSAVNFPQNIYIIRVTSDEDPMEEITRWQDLFNRTKEKASTESKISTILGFQLEAHELNIIAFAFPPDRLAAGPPRRRGAVRGRLCDRYNFEFLKQKT
ncbi:hypothetical protein EVAR_58466_1 [Eumeta japonica]|uniref:Uncharacterized protein n=1 Tax=Eumeta variegata TaxID=151549 RepID=A0A4C1YPC3_EUMVA|nr:hypothetical protein EVAR_58466_1 [Eumeta japonica]